MQEYNFYNQRFKRLQHVAATSFSRLNNPDIMQAREAAQNLYEYITSPEEKVREAFLCALDSDALRKAAVSADPDIQHTSQQVIGITENSTPLGYETLEAIQRAYTSLERDISTDVGLTVIMKSKSNQIDQLESLYNLPTPPRVDSPRQGL